MGPTARDEVARAVKTEPGLLRRGSAAAVLALLSASALAPVAVAVASGSAVTTALAGVAGGIGGGYLTGFIQKAANRLQGKSADSPESGDLRNEMAADLLIDLEKGDATARALSADLTNLLESIDGFAAATTVAQGDLRYHLTECFTELKEQRQSTLKRLDAIRVEQRRQGRRQREHGEMLEEITDQLRYRSPERPAGEDGASTDNVQPVMVTHVVESASPAMVTGLASWYGGAELVTGDRVYQIHDDLLEEHFSPDRHVARRQARGLQLVPSRRTGSGYVWLRQVQAHGDGAMARTALQALARENDLLRSLGSVRGFPRIHKFVPENRSATLVTGWPASHSRACDTLLALLGRDGTPLDAYRVFRLCTGLAELCTTLAKLHDKNVVHRHLTPAAIIMLDNGRLVLRDLGLAAQPPEPGEGPPNYQAPEQRQRSYQHPGPHTDVYQLAAVAYHLLVGRPPDAWLPLPVQAQAPQVPERIGRAVDAALTQASNGRPCIRSLGATLRAARDELS